MYGSTPLSNDLNLPYPAAAVADRHQRHQQQISSGLLRYRSAPSTLLGDLCEDFLPVRPSSPETETLFARFLGPDLRGEIDDKHDERRTHFAPPPPPTTAAMEAEDVAAATAAAHQQMYYHSQQQQMPSQSSAEGSYRMAVEADQMKTGGGGGGGGNCSNLIRQSSSPAGLFSHLNVENGYGMMRGIGNGGYKNGDGYLGEGCGPAASRLKRQISFSSRQNSATSGLMSQISEMGSEGMSPGHEESSQCYGPGGYPTGSWDDSVLSDSYSGLKRSIDGKLVNGINQSEAQNGGLGSPDIATIEKLLQFQDSVPCKIRAKRGCATHPRSIAERVRRTRISERMRKLQELVPNMDKQTNTADMLDLAVEYIKDLQGQVKTLADDRASCTCSSSKQKPYSKPV